MPHILPALLAGISAFVVYLALSAGTATPTDTIGVWSSAELLIGLLLSIITGILCRNLWTANRLTMLNPLRWLILIVYIIPFLIELTIANLSVAFKIITGKNIRPGIIRLTPGLHSDGGTLLLSASLTFQPGTATVDADEKTHDLYVHVLDAGPAPKKNIKPDDLWAKINLTKWIRRITE